MLIRKLLLGIVAVTAATFTVWSAGAGAAQPSGCGPDDVETTRDVAYVKKPVSDLQRLDVYGFDRKADCDAPVVVSVHGGGWRRGDKQAVGDKATFFNEQGYVFVSVNYRLSEPNLPEPVVHPTHAEDVGAAVAWVEHNIADHGGDGTKLALLGHSAGAHLVSLVGVDPDFIDDAGGNATDVRCVVSNDTEGYDVVARTAQGGLVQRLYENAFGTDVEVQRDASPLTHVADRKTPPDFLVITRGTPRRVAMATDFATAVEDAGASAEVLEATGLSHGDVNRLLGSAGDTTITPVVERFVAECLDRD